MNVSGILRPGERLNGTKLAQVRLRPLRLGFIVPDDDPSISVRVVESCSLTWGGYLNSIIPYSRSHGLTSEWRRILEKLDPDDMVDCAGISEADQEEFTQHRQHVHKWDDPTNTFFTVGALQYSGLKAFGNHLKSTTTQHVVINPIVTSTDTLYLPLIASWGHLNESFIEETLRLHNWSSSARYHQFVTVEDVDFGGSEKDTLLGMTPVSFRPPSGISTSHDIIGLTLLGIDQHYPPYSHGGGTLERPQYDEGWSSCVVITGKPHSVADMSLYWDLRIERPWSRPFPLWIPLENLDTDEGRQIVDTALARISPNLREAHGRSSTLYILSSSTSIATLETRLEARFPDSVIRTEDLDHFLTGEWKFDLDQTQREVYFDEGRVRVPLPRPNSLEEFASGDRITYDMEIVRSRLPSSKALNSAIFGSGGLRITRNGSLDSFSNVLPNPELVNVDIPDGWTILTSMLDDVGYECTPSD